MTKRYTSNVKVHTEDGFQCTIRDGVYDWENKQELNDDEVIDLLNEQDQRIKKLEKMLTMFEFIGDNDDI